MPNSAFWLAAVFNLPRRLIGRNTRSLKSPFRIVLLGTGILCFAAGSLLTAALFQTASVKAGNERVFELMLYHAKPGKVTELESVFRDVSKLQTKHNLTTIGYWVPSQDPALTDPAWKDTFVYLLSHPSIKDAQKNWDALHSDPAFPPYRAAAAPLIEQVNGAYRVDQVYMRPGEYSPTN